MIKIFITNNKKRLMKLAYSINDHTIPNSICIDEIDNINSTNNLTWQINNSSNSDLPDLGNNINNIKQFDFDLQYEFNSNLGNQGLLCLTGKKNNIIAKFEFYIQELSQESIDKAINDVKQFCKKNNFLKHRTELQLKLLKRYLESKKYQAIIMIHNTKSPYKDLSTQIYKKYYPQNTQFTNILISKYIKEIMQQENFILI